MSEKNTIERTIIPDKPKVIANEQLEIYIPEAAPGTKGVAEYSPLDFRVQDGKVHLRDSGKTAVQNFNMDFNTGTLTIYYTDDSVVTTSIPTDYDPPAYTDSPFDIIEFTENSFVQISDEEYHLLVNLEEMFDITDTKYLAFLEAEDSQQVGDEGETDGYCTMSDAIFKTNGKLIVSAVAPYAGRLLIVKEEHFEVHQILKALDGKLDKNVVSNTGATFLYGTNGTDYMRVPFLQNGGAHTPVKRDDTGNIRSSAAPTRDDHLTNRLYVDEQVGPVQEALDGKLDVDISKYTETGIDKNTVCYIIYYHSYYKRWVKKAIAQSGNNENRVIAGSNDGQIKQNLAPVGNTDLTNKGFVDRKTTPTEWNAETTYKKGDVVIVKSTQAFVGGNTPVKTCRARKDGLLNVPPQDYTDANWFVDLDFAYMAGYETAGDQGWIPMMSGIKQQNEETGVWEWRTIPYRTHVVWNSGNEEPTFTPYGLVQVNHVGMYSCKDPVNPYNTANKRYVDSTKTKVYKHELNVDHSLINYVIFAYCYSTEQTIERNIYTQFDATQRETLFNGATLYVYDSDNEMQYTGIVVNTTTDGDITTLDVCLNDSASSEIWVEFARLTQTSTGAEI